MKKQSPELLYKRRKYIFGFLIILFFHSNAFSQDSTTTNENGGKKIEHAVGGAAGVSTGFGLAYRIYYNKFGAQFVFTPYNDAYEELYSIGFTLEYRLISSEKTYLYLYQGNHFLYSYTDWFNCDGIGIGIEIDMFKNIGFNIMGGYAVYDFERIAMTGETALYFKF